MSHIPGLEAYPSLWPRAWVTDAGQVWRIQPPVAREVYLVRVRIASPAPEGVGPFLEWEGLQTRNTVKFLTPSVITPILSMGKLRSAICSRAHIQQEEVAALPINKFDVDAVQMHAAKPSVCSDAGLVWFLCDPPGLYPTSLCPRDFQV